MIALQRQGTRFGLPYFLGALMLLTAATAGLGYYILTEYILKIEVPSNPPVVIEVPDGPTFANSFAALRVYREFASQPRVDATLDTASYTSDDMHEWDAPEGEGGLSGRWALGQDLWDAVGVTRLRSGGVPLDGLWAHPKNDSVLVMELEGFVSGGAIAGFAGFSDVSTEKAANEKTTAPVKFEIVVDGTTVHRADIPRYRGWVPIAATLPQGTSEGAALQVRVSSADQNWGHFAFNLWPAGGGD